MLTQVEDTTGGSGRRARAASFLPSTVSMQSLKNASIMICTDALNIQLAKQVELEDHQLRAVFEGKGGSYVKEYMAATETEARQNFPNMINMTAPVPVPGAHDTFDISENIEATQTIMDDIRKLTEYLKNLTSNASPINTSSTAAHTDGHNSHDNNVDSASTADHPLTSDANAPSTARPITTSNSHTVTHGTYPTDSKRKLTTTPSYTRGNTGKTTSSIPPVASSDSKPASTTAKPIVTSMSATTLDPAVAQGLNELSQYVMGNLFNRSIDMDEAWRAANTTLHPRELLSLAAGGRVKRNADGSSTTEGQCESRGTMEDGKYMRLCSLCSATTYLGEDFFPRYINEAVCKNGESSCFEVGATAHGQCQQTMFSLNMMRRQKETCQMILHNGEVFIFDDWQLTPTKIRVACECTINKLSLFSGYVNPHPVVG
ncbi:uncharacterized protein LOC128210572 [Mya arenaria]|uniref:uncharacterized protein LOC128210572 n=1 Tax=Mya arenaria TaxID=6604 RepID=UPI0022DEA19A|nr:uncharacterized protein LOC128210572 [Mya arenaria]